MANAWVRLEDTLRRRAGEGVRSRALQTALRSLAASRAPSPAASSRAAPPASTCSTGWGGGGLVEGGGARGGGSVGGGRTAMPRRSPNTLIQNAYGRFSLTPRRTFVNAPLRTFPCA